MISLNCVQKWILKQRGWKYLYFFLMWLVFVLGINLLQNWWHQSIIRILCFYLAIIPLHLLTRNDIWESQLQILVTNTALLRCLQLTFIPYNTIFFAHTQVPNTKMFCCFSRLKRIWFFLLRKLFGQIINHFSLEPWVDNRSFKMIGFFKSKWYSRIKLVFMSACLFVKDQFWLFLEIVSINFLLLLHLLNRIFSFDYSFLSKYLKSFTRSLLLQNKSGWFLSPV